VPGDQDPLCPPEASAFMHQNIPDSTLQPLKPARHLGLIEHHRTYAKRLRDFGTEHLSRKHSVPLARAKSA
jgi:pimeloyl-ACP methyl ester carboxylesterase